MSDGLRGPDGSTASGRREGHGRRAGVLATVLVVVVGTAALGAAAGVVWEGVWTPTPGVALDGEFVYTTAGLTESFSATGSYVLVAAVAGLLAGVLVALRADGRELPALAGLVVGSALGAWLMGVVGRLLGPPDPDAAAAGAEDYTALVADLEVEGASAWLTLPAAALVGAALVFLVLSRRRHP